MYEESDKVVFKVGTELEKCDEYNKLNNTTSLHYKDGDRIVFKLPDIQYNYSVARTASSKWYLACRNGLNSRIFDALNITDKMQFCKDVSGCNVSSGQFPEIQCPNSTGISKVINKLMEMCEEKMKEASKSKEEISTETTSQKPSFKIGDYVKVISKEDVKGCDCYRFGFANEMFDYCGKIYIVCNVSYSYSSAQSEPNDGMLYKLKTAGGTVLPFNFASSMLIGTDIIPPQLHSFETKTVSKKSTPEYKLKFTN